MCFPRSLGHSLPYELWENCLEVSSTITLSNVETSLLPWSKLVCSSLFSIAILYFRFLKIRSVCLLNFPKTIILYDGQLCNSLMMQFWEQTVNYKELDNRELRVFFTVLDKRPCGFIVCLVWNQIYAVKQCNEVQLRVDPLQESK